MSLLDKQEIQDICGHTALRARKWRYDTIALGLLKKEEEEEEERRMPNRDFFPSRGAYVNCAIIVMLYTHSIGNQP